MYGFRTILADRGANVGFLISAAGFQAGAHAAAHLTNVQLLTWEEFQALYVSRWFERHLLPVLSQASEALIDFCEQWGPMALLGPVWAFHKIDDQYVLPDLLLRKCLNSTAQTQLPATILDATTLRDLLNALLTAYDQGSHLGG